ncbi:MAG: hypothetical protein ABI425_01455 [Patescibacteria group bacterium]
MENQELAINPLELKQFMPETAEQTKINKVRHILGERAKTIEDSQLETLIAQCEYLLDCWLDDYERNLFDGKTLKEIVK